MNVTVDTEKLSMKQLVDAELLGAIVKAPEAPPLQLRTSTWLETSRAHVSGFQSGIIVGFVFGCLSILAFLA